MAENEKRIKTHRIRCLSKMKMFLLAITCAFVSKTLSGSYMNSMLTQIERQFNIPTSLVGFINGSFEIGNLLLIIFVSYFGTKLHRPILIGVGCVVMGLGCFLQSLPHFLMERYEYESTVSVSGNLSSNSFLCMENGTQIIRPTEDPSECVKEVKSLMWMYVLVGNIIRGIGETPIMPLGISYIEDFAKSENSPLYIGFVETGAIIGPLFGLSLASFCANVYVDTGSVNTDDLTITPTDTRWVGAWWFGFLICAGVNVLTAIPFFFLPKWLPKEGLKSNADIIKNDKEEKQREEVKKKKDGITKVAGITTTYNGCIKPEEKSLGVGLHTFCTRVFAGIPAPIYFGALVDSTCLHWGTLKCGESGACRIYDSANFRYIYLGLPAALRGLSYIPAFLILNILKNRHLPGENASSGTMLTEAKTTKKENECKDMDQNSKVLNDNELKTKL
ncbi:solute carrier organic anion transporter family member 1A2 isoform X9 [Herpailurus yagouaroundi]|uniref:solute carrier organic anion transporter family member 1A2 isoform X9 n=1 Tax=Herpailurus yagouaroundi TaxID=1608482 RepID=UPI001AD78E2F|nr:solute carrier organic anion transporter family member 1A2 isoform X9 [Puma yagouaroundi]